MKGCCWSRGGKIQDPTCSTPTWGRGELEDAFVSLSPHRAVQSAGSSANSLVPKPAPFRRVC